MKDRLVKEILAVVDLVTNNQISNDDAIRKIVLYTELYSIDKEWNHGKLIKKSRMSYFKLQD